MGTNLKQVKGFVLIAGFMLGMLLLSGCIGQDEEVVGDHPLDGLEIEVGLIHASQSTTSQEYIAVRIAFDEVEAYAATLGIDVKFDILAEAAEESATKAGEKFDVLVARGVKFVLGLRWSSHVKASLDKANAEQILIISGASTAIALEIDDWAYRMPVADTAQGKAMAEMAISYGDGIKAIIGAYRGDTWGEGLYQSFATNFKALGGTEIESIRYDGEVFQYAAEVNLLNGYVDDARAAGFKDDEIAIMLVGFQTDASALLNQAANYENLVNIHWMGSDGTGYAEKIISEAGDTAVKVRLTSTLMYFTKTSQFYDFAEKFKAQTAEDPDI
jgi:branched-chain amino acid transport system substrate-binding protein